MSAMFDPPAEVHPGFARALEVFGSRAAIAAALGISRQAVGKWRITGVPADSAIRLERLRPKEVRAIELVDGVSDSRKGH